MIDLEMAKRILSKSLPSCTVKGVAIHDGKYVFYAPTSDPDEGEMDPFYSVSMSDGKVEGFPILLPDNFVVFSQIKMIN